MKFRMVQVFALFAMTISLVACGKSPIAPGGGGGNPVTITASPASVKVGEVTTLTWFTRASSCQASGDWSGTKSSSGSQPMGPFVADGTKTYNLTCDGVMSTAVVLVGQGSNTADTKTSPDGLVTITIVQRIPATGPLIPGQPQFIKTHIINRSDDGICVENDVFVSVACFDAHTETDKTTGSSSGSRSGSLPIISLKGSYYNKTYPSVAWTMEFVGWP